MRARLLCYTGLCVQVWRLWWEDGSGRKGGGGGAQNPSPHTSGIPIVLQTESHALQTADKNTVTTGERGGASSEKDRSRKKTNSS